MSVLPIHLITLSFTVISPIKRLPHFHGPHWSALFRNLFHLIAPEKNELSISIQPIETGVISYLPGEQINVGLVVDDTVTQTLFQLLQAFNSHSCGRGHFQPGVTIRLEESISRLTGQPWHPQDSPLDMNDIAEEVACLSQLEFFTIQTISPLRITRPPGMKTSNHRYCDADYFLNDDRQGAFGHFMAKIRNLMPVAKPSADKTNPGDLLTVSDASLTWIDASYGGPTGKTVGGVMGCLQITGRPAKDQCTNLVLGQYTGVGKNAAFGLGYYRIPELDNNRKVKALCRGTTLFGRAVNTVALGGALGQLSDSSPGPDGMNRTDAKVAGAPFLEMLSDGAKDGGATKKVSLKRYLLPKGSGGKRTIYIQNMGERILHRSYANSIAPAIDGILSASSFAYRRGLSRKNAAAALKKLLAQGFSHGIKADITAFFDSIDLEQLFQLMRGLFPAEPLIDHLCTWLKSTRAQGIAGLPQGWAVSPVLSNLYLDRFDQKMAREGFRLVRYGDDFVALFRRDLNDKRGVEIVEKSLDRLGLSLSPEKTETVLHGKALKFLGYMVSGHEIQNQPRPDVPQEEWAPVFRPDWQHGLPVYLTSVCRGAFSNGPHLVLKQADGSSDSIPWNRISRLVVVGRSTFSGGVVYRAVREQIPVTFIDIMGRTSGYIAASGQESIDHSSLQQERQQDKEWRLILARQLVAAKIHNQFVLLRRNKIKATAIKVLERQAKNAPSFETLRGYEGAAARHYFGHFAALTAPFTFDGRSYHPPDGPVNTMLSFGYTLVYNRLTAALRDKGLNPRLGFFHVGRGRHCALASDLQEPLRHLTDRIVLALIHLKEIVPKDFSSQETGGKSFCRLDGNAFRTFIRRYERTMASRFSHGDAEKISYNAWLDETVDDIVRAIRYKTPYKPLRID